MAVFDEGVDRGGAVVDAGVLRNGLELSWEFMLNPRNYGRYESWQPSCTALPVRGRRGAGNQALGLKKVRAFGQR